MMSALILLTLIVSAYSESILNRYFNEEDGAPVIRHPLEDQRVSDADVGMKSDIYIGTVGNRPIKSRQESTFVDQDGIPVPYMPYQKDKHQLTGIQKEFMRIHH